MGHFFWHCSLKFQPRFGLLPNFCAPSFPGHILSTVLLILDRMRISRLSARDIPSTVSTFSSSQFSLWRGFGSDLNRPAGFITAVHILNWTAHICSDHMQHRNRKRTCPSCARFPTRPLPSPPNVHRRPIAAAADITALLRPPCRPPLHCSIEEATPPPLSPSCPPSLAPACARPSRSSPC